MQFQESKCDAVRYVSVATLKKSKEKCLQGMLFTYYLIPRMLYSKAIHNNAVYQMRKYICQ